MRLLVAEHVFEQEVKKSRFIAIAVPLEHSDDVAAALDRVSEPDASHNCWAFRFGDTYRFSDDGEPGGTAGRPILAAIEGQGIDRVLVVVVRYFGGTKLGTGGLVRAYGGTAAECLRTAPTVPLKKMVTLEVQLPFDGIGILYPLLERCGVERLGEVYTDAGVTVQCRLEEGTEDDFAQALADATRGRAVLSKTAPGMD